MPGRPKTRAYREKRDAVRKERGVPDGKRIVVNKARKSPAQVVAKASGEPLLWGHPSDAWKTFMVEYMNTCRIDKASMKSGISRETVYNRRRQDAEFGKAFDEAKRIALGVLEDEGIRRAVEGVTEPVFYRGEECGEIQRYSDGLLQFMLSNNDPKYRNRQEIELGGAKSGAPPVINLTVTRPAPEAKKK